MSANRIALASAMALGLAAACGGRVDGAGPQPGPIVIGTSSLPQGTTGAAYAATLAAAGGTTPYAWSMSAGTLPAGLALSSGTGAISGIPTAAGSYSFTVGVTDSSSTPQSAARSLSITVIDPLAIVTSEVTEGTTGVTYAATLAASGGTPPYAWSLSAGTLPTGLALDAGSGAISGTPTAVGSSTFTIRVTDSSSPQRSATRYLSITVAEPIIGTLAITTTALPVGPTGQAYGVQLAASGGTGPYTWSVAPGHQLPPGLTLSAGGVISGTPTTASQGPWTIGFQVSDASLPAQSDFAQLSMFVNHASILTITTSALPVGTTGQPYGAQLNAVDGTGAYTWSVAPGYQLPPGLTLSAAGVISGTPTTATQGPWTLWFEVSDESLPAQIDFVDLSIRVDHASILTATTSALPVGTTGQPYSVQLAASGGTGPYTWSVAPGYQLPPGLTLSAAGAISGTSTTATQGPWAVWFQVSDASLPAQSDAVSLLIVVESMPSLLVTTSYLPPATAGAPYTVQLSSSGGTSPYGWSVASGALPPGLALDPGTGVLSGTPTTQGSSVFTIQVTDGSSPPQTSYANLSLTVRYASMLLVTTSHLPPATAGAPYTVQLSSSGGASPYGWSVASGALPPGLALNSATGVVSGTPATRGVYYFDPEVTDASLPPQQAWANLYLDVR